MMHSPVNGWFKALVFLLVCSFGGCALTGRQIPSYNAEISEIMASVEAQNQTVATVNGLGAITISDKGQISRYRLAWAAAFPDRIRLIVLFSGKPIESVAYDGQFLTLKSHTDAHALIKKKKKNPDLESLTTLPLRTEQIIEFLCGRIPIQPHRSAQLQKDIRGDYVLTLLNKKNHAVEILYLDDEKRVKAYDIPNKNQAHYQVTLKNSDSTLSSDLSFPSQITIDQNDRSLIMRIDQTQPNPDLPADAFKIVSE